MHTFSVRRPRYVTTQEELFLRLTVTFGRLAFEINKDKLIKEILINRHIDISVGKNVTAIKLAQQQTQIDFSGVK